ncbi:helix-turn-helix domain-containing protein [uncultured Sphingomonas sp.]|uniref:helix-turn-helix domain-containing protein n=1 Tax=uncultured Sphingomonas sp. TaxID=158754 RepID=UPI002587A95F|nr:helix-turn-helix domain-containing protein [uncultured Sphingomonas sp.]
MTLGRRIDDRRRELGISQAELARRVGMRQSTLNSLINGASRSSRKIVELAQHLRTTPAYLVGHTDDPEEGGLPSPPPAPAEIFLKVTLPPEEALGQMFEALLSGLDRNAPLAEQARLLAKRLPIGLSQLQELRPAPIRARARIREQA